MNLLHVIQHTSADYLGLMEDHLEGRRIRFRYFRPFTEQGAVPGPEEICDGLVLLGGGPWGSAGVRDVPTLKQEIELTEAMLNMAKPVIGIGLGAQILAYAAGGGSTPAPLISVSRRSCGVSPSASSNSTPDTSRAPAAIRRPPSHWPLFPRMRTGCPM